MVKLKAMEARVLGALMEKEITTPEYYPLSLHALVNACNQKSSRDPVMELSEADVRGVLFSLEEPGLVRRLDEGRVSKFEHRMRDGLGPAPEDALRRDEFAVVCLLLLRGPQTAAELRARAERLYSFDDVAAVTATLERLAGREEPLTRLLARQAGAREARWAQLLTGADDANVIAGAECQVEGAGPIRLRSGQAGGPGSSANEELVQRVGVLEELVRSLEERLRVLEDCGAFRAE